MKGMFLKKCDIYYQKCATAAQRFQLSMTKLGACDEIRWNDGTGCQKEALSYPLTCVLELQPDPYWDRMK